MRIPGLKPIYSRNVRNMRAYLCEVVMIKKSNAQQIGANYNSSSLNLKFDLFPLENYFQFPYFKKRDEFQRFPWDTSYIHSMHF